MFYDLLDGKLDQARQTRSDTLHAWWWRTLARYRNSHLAARGCGEVPRDGVTVARPCGA